MKPDSQIAKIQYPSTIDFSFQGLYLKTTKNSPISNLSFYFNDLSLSLITNWYTLPSAWHPHSTKRFVLRERPVAFLVPVVFSPPSSATYLSARSNHIVHGDKQRKTAVRERDEEKWHEGWHVGEEAEASVAKAVVEVKGVCVLAMEGDDAWVGSSARGSLRRDIRRLLVVVIARWSWWYYHGRTLEEKDAEGGGKGRA
ncbi:hypothetical protein K0M31_014010 [Melipona bicolor]|uniref:Uncharacterized protein n=1 Tax=Melipona bicolor TaxID=60889 RepID=A0AA40G7Y7_9HYME|nr:hypothetical protein K0M31_014010 [Melipona bicolor]